MHLAKVANNILVKDLIPVTENKKNHGDPHRATPCGAAHPNGGVLVIYEEFGKPNGELFLQHIQ